MLNFYRAWCLCCILLTPIAHAQDVNGDLNTNIQDSTVDSNNNSNATTNNYNSGPPGAMSNPVPTAMAPTVMGGGGNDSCLIPSSTGLQISLFGIASGTAKQDQECNRRKDARLLGAPQAIGGLGLQVAGISAMCANPQVFKAMTLSNTPCPINDVATGKLLIGRAAFEKYRSNPSVFVVGYEEDKAFWDAILAIGEDLPDVETTTDNRRSLSEQFRSASRRTGNGNNGECNSRRPSECRRSNNESDRQVEDPNTGD